MSVKAGNVNVESTSTGQVEDVLSGKKTRPERLGIRQIETIKKYRRQGLGVDAIAELMGISRGTVSKHAKGIRPPKEEKPQNGSPSQVSEQVPAGNGQQTPGLAGFLGPSTPQKLTIPVQVNGDYLLLLAGDAVRLGYKSFEEYLKDTMDWVACLTDLRRKFGLKTVEEYNQAIELLVKKANELDDILKRGKQTGAR